MNRLLLTIVVASLLTGCARTPYDKITKLPRPNSGTYSYAEADARKHEVFQAAVTERLPDWNSEYLGFSIHLKNDGMIETYNGSFIAETPWDWDDKGGIKIKT